MYIREAQSLLLYGPYLPDRDSAGFDFVALLHPDLDARAPVRYPEGMRVGPSQNSVPT